MGKHEAGWSDPIQSRLKKLAAGVKARTSTPFQMSIGPKGDEEVVLREVAYDHIFENELSRTGRDADEIIKLGELNGVELPVKDLFGWLQTASDEEKNFFYTHVLDVVMFRTFPHIWKQVTEYVAKEIVKGYEEFQSTQTAKADAHVLAHSLGTAVTEQTLHRMATLRIGGSTVLQPPAFRFRSVGMLANVSRILQHGNVYNSIVRSPQLGGGPDFYVREYLTFRHALDPFTMWKPFNAPTTWDRQYYQQPDDYGHYLLFNIHDAEHYLIHPATHLNLFNAWWNDRITTRSQILAASTAYRPAGPTTCEAEMLELHDRLVEIRDQIREGQRTWLAWIKGIVQLGVLVPRLLARCPNGGTLP
jgi:hypothetical protein